MWFLLVLHITFWSCILLLIKTLNFNINDNTILQMNEFCAGDKKWRTANIGNIFSWLNINILYIFTLMMLKTSLISSTHKQSQNGKNMNTSSNDVDIQYRVFSVCTAISNISLEHMYRQLSQKSIRAECDDDNAGFEKNKVALKVSITHWRAL